MEYEVKRAQMQAKAEAKLAKQNDRALRLAHVKLEKEKAWRAALRTQELKRLANEKEEEERTKKVDRVCASGNVLGLDAPFDSAWPNMLLQGRQMWLFLSRCDCESQTTHHLQDRFLKEQEFLGKERVREKEARMEAYQKEQDRVKKAEQAREETERILEAQQRAVDCRKRDMAVRDAEREAKKLDRQKILVSSLPTVANVGRLSCTCVLLAGRALRSGVAHRHGRMMRNASRPRSGWRLRMRRMFRSCRRSGLISMLERLPVKHVEQNRRANEQS